MVYACSHNKRSSQFAPAGSNPCGVDFAMSEVSDHLRQHVNDVMEHWLGTCERLPGMENMSRGALIDHLPEFLEGMAKWIEGDQASARKLFDLLAEGHALQRAGHGVPLETLTAEYTVLRRVVLRRLAEVLPPSREVLDDLVQFNEGMDEAIGQAVQRYTRYRDLLRDRFIGILGHDLRNPLGSVAMSSASILAWTRDDRTRRLATVINRSADRMARMVSAISDFTRAHLGGGIPIEPLTIDMHEVCEEAAMEIRAAYPDREVIVSCSGSGMGAWDHDRVLQVLSNLLGNAVQHAQSTIQLTVREEPDRRAVTTSVHNDGSVIPAEDIPRMFDPFRGSRRGGLGLGLYIVQQIALAHGTTCEVHTTKADGTTFTIRWPRTPPEEVPERP